MGPRKRRGMHRFRDQRNNGGKILRWRGSEARLLDHPLPTPTGEARLFDLLIGAGMWRAWGKVMVRLFAHPTQTRHGPSRYSIPLGTSSRLCINRGAPNLIRMFTDNLTSAPRGWVYAHTKSSLQGEYVIKWRLC